MNYVLAIILLILCILVGGVRGLKSFIVLLVDILFCVLNIILIGKGLNPILTTFILCLILINIILYFVNGYNKKTISSYISSVIILLFLILSVYIITYLSKTQGFGYEYVEEISWCSFSLNINFIYVATCSVIIGLIGSIVDTSTAISTAVNEIYEHNKDISFHDLIKSGYNVGKDVIATVTNTLFFAFLSNFLTLIIWFKLSNYTITDILNNKIFVSEVISIMFNAIGSCLIIPLTNYITSYLLVKKNKFTKRIEKRIIEHNT